MNKAVMEKLEYSRMNFKTGIRPNCKIGIRPNDFQNWNKAKMIFKTGIIPNV